MGGTVRSGLDQSICEYHADFVTHEGRRMRQVTMPSGVQIRLECAEMLLDINGAPDSVVSTAEDVIYAIRLYAAEHNLKTFRVRDLVQCRNVATGDDVYGDQRWVAFLAIAPA